MINQACKMHTRARAIVRGIRRHEHWNNEFAEGISDVFHDMTSGVYVKPQLFGCAWMRADVMAQIGSLTARLSAPADYIDSARARAHIRGELRALSVLSRMFDAMDEH